MAGKSGMRQGLQNSGRKPDKELAQALLTVLGVGIAGGIALLGSAVKLGEKILDLQVKAYEKIEAEREAHREAIRNITENEMGYDNDDESDSQDDE